MKPTHPIFGKLLDLRLQFRLMQVEIVNSTDPHNGHFGKPSTPSIHESATNRAEGVLHGIASGDGLALGEFRELLLAAKMLQAAILDDEV